MHVMVWVDQLVAEGSSLALQVGEGTVDAPFFVGLHAFFDILLTPRHYQTDQASQFAGGRGYRDGSVLSGETGAMFGADEGLAPSCRHGCHAQGLSDRVDPLVRPAKACRR